ncbi:MAG: transketolase C-terminal domain-containing protein [Candidatus Jacksonbacteria bacterium]
MRNAWIKTLTTEAKKKPDIILIVGDLGFAVIEEFRAKFPNQFLNAGVAEQNMTGIAAGLALSGKTVFTYSIGNFTTLRPLEQIRNDICYHNANVKIISVGGGFDYYSLGPTHHATEDLAIIRSLPNMTVVAPGDPVEAKLATRAIIKHKGPCYLRLGRAPIIHQKKPKFKIGQAITVLYGNDLTLIATGGMLAEAAQTAKILSKQHINARVLSMHTIKPIDKQAIIKSAKETKAIFTLEDHQITGGLGSAVAEVLALYPSEASGTGLSESQNNAILFKRFGIPDIFIKDIGSVKYIKKKLGLTAAQISKQIMKLVTK